jgi:hypothetical protein
MYRHEIVTALAAIVIARGLAAQPASQLKFAAATELANVEFSRIGGVRELSDGRVLVIDSREKQLLLVDFAKGSAAKRGREGSGPGEYRGLNQLIALSGDSTLVVDVPGGRWLVMVRDSFTAVISGSDPALAVSRNPLGADERGHVLATRPARNLYGAIGNVTFTNDSSWLVRVERKTGRTDTLTKYRIRPSRIAVQGTAERPTSVEIVMNPISTGELSVMYPDGAIAIARLDPFRVDWIIGGNRVSGKPLPFNAVPVSLDEKKAILARMARSNGQTSRDPESVKDWPEVFPPFLPGSALAAPDGRLWIRRAPSLRAPATDYDVIDRSGRLAGRLHIPANETVVGFGRASVYVVRTDDDDLQHLKRYLLPR